MESQQVASEDKEAGSGDGSLITIEIKQKMYSNFKYLVITHLFSLL